MSFYLGLVHYPVYDRRGKIIVSAITNLDLHDLARLAKTYGAQGFYIINPLTDQQELAERICEHWVSGYGAHYNKDRRDAMSLVRVVPTLERAVSEIRNAEGESPVLLITDARKNGGQRISYEVAQEVVDSNKAAMILFGTAWGIAEELIREADYALEPILGVSDYNHLSVRAAAAITLDRLFSRFAGPERGR